MTESKEIERGAKEAPCYFCNKKTKVENAECFGCGEIVCEDCDEVSPMGAHFVEDHKEDE